MRTLTTIALMLLATCSNAQDENFQDTPYPLDKITNRITFRDSLDAGRDSVTSAKKLQDYLYTNYADVKQVGNKTYCNGSFEVHKRALNGGIAKGRMNVQGNVSFVMIVEHTSKEVIVTKTNFQFVGATKANPVSPIYGQKMKIADKPLEEAKLNKEEIFMKMEMIKAEFNRLLYY